jgi:hypothetical protein
MRPRRLKVEFYDAEGVRHSISIDGPVSREKVGKILDLVELMAGTNRPSPIALGLSQRKFDKLTSMIISQLKDRAFSSREVKKAFETSFRERIPLSTVSTYLGRLLDRGILDREQGSDGLVYRVRLEELKQPLAPGLSGPAW